MYVRRGRARARWPGRLAWGVVALVAMGGSVRLPAQAASAPDALAGLRSAWTQALQQHDLEAAVALYEPDAIFLSADGGRYPDRAAIRTLYRSVFGLYRATVTMTSQKRDCSGVLCVDTGTYGEKVSETASGKRFTDAGSYVLVARRQPDHSWKIAEMAWTGRGPAPIQ